MKIKRIIVPGIQPMSSKEIIEAVQLSLESELSISVAAQYAFTNLTTRAKGSKRKPGGQIGHEGSCLNRVEDPDQINTILNRPNMATL
jgi:hypothetical protein